MPSYTILLMRADLTDRRPFRINIGTKTFWFLVLLACTAPITGFMLSFGILAPAWIKNDFKNMQESVEQAKQSLQPLQEQNAELAAKKSTLEEQLKAEREARAKAETEVTMARTARLEASTRLAQLEGDIIGLKKSLATYESLLKPKLERELVQCVDLEATMQGTQVSYRANFTRVSKTAKVPSVLTARVRLLTGDNAVAMEQNAAQAGGSVIANHQLEVARSPSIRGTLPMPAGQVKGSTRLVDIKVYDGQRPVGYCWKSF